MTGVWSLLCSFPSLQADQSGTIVEILAEDGKPVSMESVCTITFLSYMSFAFYRGVMSAAKVLFSSIQWNMCVCFGFC